MNRQLSLLILVLIVSILFSSCKNDDAVGPGKINPEIVTIMSSYNPEKPLTGGNYLVSIFIDSRNILSLAPPHIISLNSDLSVNKDTLLQNLMIDGSFRYLFANKSPLSEKILLVFSQYSNVSCGSLYEYDLQSSKLSLIKDSTFNISSAVYFKTKPNECIYYSYGNPSYNIEAGYYELNTITKEEKLLMSHMSGLEYYALAEFSNGFDLSPDDKRMIFPIHNARQAAHAAFFDITTKQIDTLKFNFPGQFVWFRFSHSGTKLLYNSYPYGMASRNVNGYSDLGIIDLSDLSSRVLDVNTKAGWTSISMCPDWSPDDKSILFGSGPGPTVEPPGAVGFFSAYIIRNVQ